MFRLLKLFIVLVALTGLGLWGENALAAARTASVAGNWNLPATWGGAAVPTNADTCTINSGISVTVNTAGATCGSLTIGNATSSTTTFTMASPGSLSITTVGGQTGNLVMNPNNNNRTYTLAVATGVLTVDGTFTTSTTTGTNNITVSTGQINFTRVAGITWPTLGTLNVTGNNAGGSVNFAGPVTQAGGTLSNNGGTINFAGLVTQTGGTITNVTTAGTFSFNGGLNHSAGTFTTLSGETLNFGGNLTMSGGTTTFIAGSTENFTNTATITPTSAIIFGNLVINPGAGKTVTLAGSVTAAGNLTVTTGTFDLATFTAARTATGGTLTIANGAKMLVGASNYPANYTTDTLGATSTVEYDGPAQTVTAPTGGLGYGNLTLSGSGTKTLPAAALPIQGSFTMAGAAGTSATAGGALTVGGNFVLGSGNTFSASTFSHSVAGNFTNNGGTFTASTSTITLNGAAPQTIGGTSNTTFNNLTVNGSGGVTLASSPTIGGTLALTTGTFAVGANTLTLNGPTIAGTPANLTTTSSSNLVFGGSSAGVLVPSSVGALNNLTINNASGVTLSGSPTLSGTLTLTSGTLTVGANNLTLNGPTIAGTPANLVTSASSSLSFGGSSAGVLVPSSVGALNNLTINNANGVTLSGNPTLSGTLTLTSGTLTVGAYTLTLNGPAIAGTSTNLVTTSSSNLSFGGSSTGVFLPSSVVALNNFTINNANGLALNSSPTVSGTLALTSGVVTAGSYTLRSSANCSTGVTVGTGYVAGSVELTFPLGSATCRFPVGSGNYAPIDLTKPLISGGGKMTGSTTGNEHPDVANSPVDSTNDVNRYWTLSGDTIGASSYTDVTFWFVAGDVDAGANPLGFVLGRKASGVWTTPASPTTSALSTAAGLTGPIAGVTDFVAGKAAFVCSVPSSSPPGTTCVCDNFNRLNLNPSTMFPGASWTPSSVSGTFGLPRIVNNRLRLTDASGNVATAATSPGTYPAAGNWVSVEFKHYAYGGNGADGVAFTLSDATITAAPGAFGGSLGYAQKCQNGVAGCVSDCNVAGGCPGFTGGWIGIGIDEYGNFSNPTEGRSGGPAASVDSVSVRGSGSGPTGYPYLGGTGTLTPPIDAPSPATDGFGYAYRLMVDARCYQLNGPGCGNPSLAKKTQITLERDTTGSGTSYSPLLTPFDAYAVNSSQAVVPANWQLSFTGSTGGATNIHEIIGLKICAQTIVPPAGYQINVDNMSPTTCNTDPKPTVTVTTLNSNGQVATTYANTVTLSAKLSGGANPTGTVTWAKITGAGTLTPTGNGVATYNYVTGDNGVASFSLFDTNAEGLFITVTETPGTLTTTLGAPVQFTSGAASFVVSTPDSLGTGVVAGRAHLMRITRNQAACGGGTNTTYSGTKSLDGWYNPAVGDHPDGALAPKICAPVSGACLPSHGSCVELSIAPPVVDSGSNNVNGIVTFTSGVANFCLVTTDVGKYSVGLRDDSTATGTPAVTGTSVTLTARPFAVVVSGMTGNPAGTTDTDLVFTSAGSPFPATVGGYLWSSSADTGANGLPGNVDLGTMTAAGLASHYADTVTLAADTSVAGNFAPVAPPATQGSLSSSSVTVSGGSGSSSTLAYSEVGSFTLKATPASSYLNSGVDLGPRVAIFSNPASASQNKWVGRFKPHHFTLFADTRTNRAAGACSPAAIFTYLDEGLDLTFTLSAEAQGGWTTTNYVGFYAKLVPTLFSNYAVGVRSGTTNLTPRMSGAIIGTPAWAAGVLSAAVARVTVAARSVLPSPLLDGPWASTQFGMAPIDSDGTQLPATALNLDVDNNATFDHQTVGATTELRFGRLRLLNAFGSERMALPMSWETQYWNGEAFVRNAQDGCTSLLPANITMGMYTAPPNPGPTVLSAANLSTVTVNAISAGLGTLTLAPTANATGSVAVVVNLGNGLAGPSDGGNCTSLIATPSIVAIASGTPNLTSSARPYLNGKWCGSGSNYDQDPFARASFGVYKSPIIYRRENY